MSQLRKPPDPDPIPVKEVGKNPVPFLRPLDWVATSLRTFRERPLPSTYTTEAVPTFDLFGNARIENVQFEEVLGTLGDIEVTSAKVDPTEYRYYLSFTFQHDDLVSRRLQPGRIIANSAFPFVAIADEAREGVAPPNIIFTIRNVTVPPEGRLAARVEAIGGGSRITLQSLFIDYKIGEPTGDIT